MSDENMQEEMERLRAENESLRKHTQKKEGLRVSEKGAVSLYGIRRFPITFYADEWRRILGMREEIQAFIEQNHDSLKSKD